MTDIIERLRDTRTGKTTSPDWPYGLLRDASDEIENLRADVDFLMGLLNMMSEAADDDTVNADDPAGYPEGAS